MKYVVTGAAGKISKPLARRLLAAGHSVTVIGRNEKNLEPSLRAGAKAAIGSVEDVSFLKKAFAGADAVYTMVPADIFAADLKSQNELIGKAYAEAIKANGIRHVVNLSSIGAHIPQGAGPMSALHYAEQALYSLQHVHVRTIRAVYFYQNLLSMKDMIRHMNIMGSNFSLPAGKFPIVHTDDVAAVIAEELLKLNFSGHTVRYVASDETGTDEIASVLGKAIGHPALKWMKFSPEEAFEGMRQFGFPAAAAQAHVDMFNAVDSGQVTEDYWKNRPQKLGSIKLDDFAKQFAAIFNQAQQVMK